MSAADIVEAAAVVALHLDGTYGRTWAQVADELDQSAANGERVYVNPQALANLIRALVAHGGLLPDG